MLFFKMCRVVLYTILVFLLVGVLRYVQHQDELYVDSMRVVYSSFIQFAIVLFEVGHVSVTYGMFYLGKQEYNYRCGGGSGGGDDNDNDNTRSMNPRCQYREHHELKDYVYQGRSILVIPNFEWKKCDSKKVYHVRDDFLWEFKYPIHTMARQELIHPSMYMLIITTNPHRVIPVFGKGNRYYEEQLLVQRCYSNEI